MRYYLILTDRSITSIRHWNMPSALIDFTDRFPNMHPISCCECPIDKDPVTYANELMGPESLVIESVSVN